MKNIALFYGGKSVEHDISVITALQTMANMPKEYNLIPIYSIPSGEFVTADNLNDKEIYLNFTKNAKNLRKILLNLGKNEIFVLKNDKIKKKIKIDFALLCNHGHGGEDGCLQGLLELCDIPYSSSSLPSSAIIMDKVLTKIYLTSEHIANLSFVHFDRNQFEFSCEEIYEKIKKQIGFPCIVKPACLGSSVGISICSNENMLTRAVEDALEFDDKIIVEKFVEKAREFCCAAIKSGHKIYLSRVIEVHNNDIYTFDEKYLSERKNENGEIDKNIIFRVKRLTEKVYEKLACAGVVRIDFLYNEEEDKLYVNEPNSIPGSLAFNMFEGKFEDLIRMIVESGLKTFESKMRINYVFNSEAIKYYIETSKNSKFSK